MCSGCGSEIPDDNSLAALDKAVEIARHFGSTLILLHVLPLVLTSGEVPPPAAMYEDQEKAARAKQPDIAKQKLAGPAARVACVRR